MDLVAILEYLDILVLAEYLAIQAILVLVVGLAILIGGVGLALNYAEKLQEEKPIPQPKSNWGIFSDSPIRR